MKSQQIKALSLWFELGLTYFCKVLFAVIRPTVQSLAYNKSVVCLDFMELKQMLEKIGQPKTHLECKKMIKEVNKRDSDTINYREFLDMMLGSKNSVLRL